ncbi:MAG: transposase [Alphaproteobacteria bacterium]
MVRKQHSEDFKREAVKLALSSGLPREVIAEDLGIGKSTLGKWIAKYRLDQRDEHRTGAEDADLRSELARLRWENRVLR